MKVRTEDEKPPIISSDFNNIPILETSLTLKIRCK